MKDVKENNCGKRIKWEQGHKKFSNYVTVGNRNQLGTTQKRLDTGKY